MNATPTTTVDILGGAPTQDAFGDQEEGLEVILAGVPAAITETRQIVATESDAQAVAVHYYTGRLPAGTPVERSQRIRDAQGNVYSIDYVNDRPASPAIPADVRLDLRRVS